MKLIAFVALLGCVSCYEVPQPLFEVFHPKGLRASIPDSDNIESVQFLLSVKPENEEATELFDDVEKSEDGRWIYWNPEAELAVNDVIYYKITVENDDIYWTKEGEHKVDKVYSTSGEPVAASAAAAAGGRLGYGYRGGRDIFRQHHKGLITEGKKSSYQSSYSSYQSGDSAPVTRSSSVSTTGTIVMKPGGDVEASGYKKESNYDSTKEGSDKWHETESELTASELEDLRNYFGMNFRSFSDLTAGQVEEFKRFHGGSALHAPEKIRATMPETRSYEESYFKKESTTSDFARHPLPHRYAERSHQERYDGYRQEPVRPDAYHQEPVRPDGYHQEPVRPSATNRYEVRSYGHQSAEFKPASRPAALSHSVQVDSADYNPEPTHVRPATYYQSGRRVENYDSRTSTTSVRRENAYEPNDGDDDGDGSDDVQTVEKPKFATHYRGAIFESARTTGVSSPQECVAWSENNYSTVNSVREVQKSISRMQCMAAVAEHSVNEELRLLREDNRDLVARMDSLEREFRRFRNTCRCSG